MILDISHTTIYKFDKAPRYGLQQIRLSPKFGQGQSVLSWDLSFDGASVQAQFVDYNENAVTLILLDEDVTALSVKTQGRVEMSDQNGIIGPHTGYAPLWLFLRQTPLTRAGQGVLGLVDTLSKMQGTELENLHALVRLISGRVVYQAGQTDTLSTAEDALRLGAGVCQDHSHIFIAVARAAGFPARYVSGYLMMNDRIAQDATHAWAEVYIESLGWVGFDVSNEISPDARYVRVATGLDYSGAAPISGLTIGAHNESISVDVSVQQ